MSSDADKHVDICKVHSHSQPSSAPLLSLPLPRHLTLPPTHPARLQVVASGTDEHLEMCKCTHEFCEELGMDAPGQPVRVSRRAACKGRVAPCLVAHWAAGAAGTGMRRGSLCG